VGDPGVGLGEVVDWPSAGEQAFTQYSFLDVVRGDIRDEVFRDKAVLVAGTAPGLDDRDFPFAVEAPGVLSYATFLDNLLRADFVGAPTWAWLLEALFAGLLSGSTGLARRH
jgi:CHASE2 domain-containing sensor protein